MPLQPLCEVHVDFALALGHNFSTVLHVELAFGEIDIEIEWQGSGAEEIGVEKKSGRTLIEIDPRYYRPAEVELLIGDPTKAREVLGWESKISLQEMVSEMVAQDLVEIAV